MSKHSVQRPRHLGEIQGDDEQGGVFDLPAASGAHEAPELLLTGPSSPLRLLLERAERLKVTLSVDHPFHGGSAEGADQLVLQICDAHVETESFHVGAGEVGTEAGPLESALEVDLLCGVTEARQCDVKPLRAEQIQEASDVLRTPHWQNRNALSVKLPTTALSEGFERELVADPFNKHDRTGEEGLRVSRDVFLPCSSWMSHPSNGPAIGVQSDTRGGPTLAARGVRRPDAGTLWL
jgi:hypothetical protein